METQTRPSNILTRSISHGFGHHSREYGTGVRGLFSSKSSNNSTATLLPSQQKIEEERNPKYNPDAFYPAKIDEVLAERYRLIAKLGYGMTATVWLARDLSARASDEAKYVTIKINVNTLSQEHFKSRRQISEKLATTDPSHPGYHHVRFSLNSFKIKGARHGIERSPEHLCIVYHVLREPIDDCMRRWPTGRFTGARLRLLLPSLLKGLDYMHSCGVVHTDLKADNIMMGLGSPEVLDNFVEEVSKNPPARKHLDHGRVIYESRSSFGPAPTDDVIKSAKITDIGLAEWGDQENNKPIQSNAFTAPEVILTAGWSYPADIWNLGVMTWDIIGEDGLFDCISTEPGKYHSDQHLGAMINLLGPPPAKLLERGSTSATYFNGTEFRKPKLINAKCTWESQLKKHLKGEERELFIDFAKKMIRWLPEERWTAKQLLEHPFLTKTEFKQWDDPAEESGLIFIEQFAKTKPRSNTMTPAPTPSPPAGTPAGPSPAGTPAPSIKGLTTGVDSLGIKPLAANGRASTVSSIATVASNATGGLSVTGAPLVRSSSHNSVQGKCTNEKTQSLIDNILSGKRRSGTSTPVITEEPAEPSEPK
jgi:serine/threonine-protein kinase SRPK3